MLQGNSIDVEFPASGEYTGPKWDAGLDLVRKGKVCIGIGPLYPAYPVHSKWPLIP